MAIKFSPHAILQSIDKLVNASVGASGMLSGGKQV